jgi:hypothetical protein
MYTETHIYQLPMVFDELIGKQMDRQVGRGKCTHACAHTGSTVCNLYKDNRTHHVYRFELSVSD